MTTRKNALRILEILRKVIYSDTIIEDYRMNRTDFSRTRKQPFGDMLLFMINFLKKSLPIEIDNFVNFINMTGNTYTFVAGSGSILSDGGKNKSSTQYTAVSAVFNGTNWHLIGKLSA